MSWSTVITILSYLLLPVTFIFNVLLIILAPLLHLGSFALAACMLPLRILAKFETLYIYIGVAAVIGIITGSILHVSSTILVSIFDLAAVPEEIGRTAASVRAAREQKKLEGAWESSILKGESAKLRNDPSTRKKQAEWLESELNKRRENQGLLGQTILEEEDDSDF